MEVRLRLAAIPYHVMTDIVLDRDRSILAEASRLTEQLRSCDPSYQSELDWWTSPFALIDGIPQTSLVSDSEAGRGRCRSNLSVGQTDRFLLFLADDVLFG